MSREQAAALLQVSPHADAQAVQHAFLRAARRVHPDTIPLAGEAERRAATEAFTRLLHARDLLLQPAPAADAWTTRPGDPEGPRYRRVQGRGLGGSLVVLALLAFLLVALVTLQNGLRGEDFGPGSSQIPARSPLP